MKEILNNLKEFRDQRDWAKFHNPKDLAISISLEASELLENFQWKSSEKSVLKNHQNIKEELSDVMIYSLLLSDALGIDMEEAIKEKIAKNEKKYPVSKAYGTSKKYDEL